MTTRRLIIGFFVLYALLIPVLAREFVKQNTSAAAAMIGCTIIIAFLLWSKRVVVLNLLIAFYVFQNYLTRPFISVFEGGLSLESLLYIEVLGSYETPHAAAVVYWGLFSLLLAWSIGLLLLPSPRRNDPFSIPKVFTKLDAVMMRNGLPLVGAIALLFVLNYTSPESGLRGATSGEGESLFLFGLASLSTVSIACLYAFLRERHAGLRRASYLLLVPPLLEVGRVFLGGSRGAMFHFLVVGLVYWLLLEYDREWRPLALAKAALVSAAAIVATIGVGLFAQVLGPLYRYTTSVDLADILEILSFDAVIRTGDALLFGVTELLYRLSSLSAQFYILNDWYVYEPWQHYNPVAAMMRVINALMPGDVFLGMLSINQLFNYVYFGTPVYYASEMWSIQGTLYLYFGHLGAPVVVLVLAIIANQLYPWLHQSVRASPALAAFVIPLMLDIMTNGTAERIIPVDIVRPLASFVIFILIYGSFSLILPTRIRWSRSARSAI